MTSSGSAHPTGQARKVFPRLVVIQVAVTVVAVLAMVALLLQIGPLVAKKSELEDTITRQNALILELEQQEDLLQQKIDQLVEQLTKLETFKEIEPKARSEYIPGGETASGRALYEYALWLELPLQLQTQVEKVQYKLDHPTFVTGIATSAEESDGFAVSYTGWACIAYVKVTVFLKDGTVQPIHFNMCKSMTTGEAGPHQ